MKKLMVLGLLLAATPALAQNSITLPPNTVLGRTGITAGPAQAIPFATLNATTISTILSTPNQTLSGGANVVTDVLPTGNVTINCGLGPLQTIINGGAFTITKPALDGSCMLLVQNNASAGAITFSGFSVGGFTGDPLDTTNAHNFSIFIWSISGVAGYRIAAHQ